MNILFVLDYMRFEHFNMETKQNQYLSTKAGKKIMQYGKSAGLKPDDISIDYAYAQIPKMLSKGKYKEPKATESRQYIQPLHNRIVETKPDMIVPLGNLGCKALIGKTGITNLRGIPQRLSFSAKERIENVVEDTNEGDTVRKSTEISWGDVTGEHTVWVMPMRSMENLLFDPNLTSLIEADFKTLKSYVDFGDKAFEVKKSSYDFITDFNEVEDILTNRIYKHDLVAWDLETNTLHPEVAGAKPLVMSLSFGNNHGLTIPLEHSEKRYFGQQQLEQIYNWLKKWLGSDSVKVGHNLQYDIRFLTSVLKLDRAINCRDTKIGYWLSVNQDKDASKDLSSLAYTYTQMGGYDFPLEQYKKDFRSILDKATKEIRRQNRQLVKSGLPSLNGVGLFEVAKKLFGEYTEKWDKVYDHTRNKFVELIGLFGELDITNEVDGSDFNYEWIPLDLMHPYASGDVDCCIQIHNELIPAIDADEQLSYLFKEHHPELTETLAQIESIGISLDVEYASELDKQYEDRIEELRQDMRTLPEVQELEAQKQELYQAYLEEKTKPVKERNDEIMKFSKYKDKIEYNPSPNAQDNGRILYEILGYKLPYNKEMIKDGAWKDQKPEESITWADYKADTKGALPYLIEHENSVLAEKLMNYSKVVTLRQNFTKKLPTMVRPDGRIHGSFNSTGTQTTRLSSRDPNLQQIPRKTGDVNRFDYKHPIKRLFKTSFEDGLLIQADYSSLEVRVLGLVCGDPKMLDDFLNDKDTHVETASMVLKKPPEQITDDERSNAKAVTFGLMYGESPASVAPKLDITKQAAEQLFQDYFRNKPKVKGFIDSTHALVKQDEFVRTLAGFKRLLRTVKSQDKMKVSEALRQSVNTIIQGTGAFLTNRAVIMINRMLRELNMRARVVLTVHDSIVADAPADEIHQTAYIMTYVMENLPLEFLFVEHNGERIRYPIKADIEVGVNYNDMTGYDKDDLASFARPDKYVEFHTTLKAIKNNLNSKEISEEEYTMMTDYIKGQKPVYQGAA